MHKLVTRTAFGMVSTAALAIVLFHPAVAQQKTVELSDGRIVYVTTAPGDSTSLSTFYSRNVFNTAGDRLGDINDLLLGSDRKISTAVIGVGGFLGLGEKEIAVPFDALKVVRKDNTWHLVLDATKEQLKAAPAFVPAGDRVRVNAPSMLPPAGGAPTTLPKQ